MAGVSLRPILGAILLVCLAGGFLYVLDLKGQIKDQKELVDNLYSTINAFGEDSMKDRQKIVELENENAELKDLPPKIEYKTNTVTVPITTGPSMELKNQLRVECDSDYNRNVDMLDGWLSNCSDKECTDSRIKFARDNNLISNDSDAWMANCIRNKMEYLK